MKFPPTPTHLREIAAPLDEQSSEGLLRASIACPCGEAMMEFRYPGETHLAVDATCVRCGRIEQDLISYETM